MPLVEALVGTAYTDYLGAIVAVGKKKDAELKKIEKQTEGIASIVLAIAFIPAGPFIGAAAAGLGSPLKNLLTSKLGAATAEKLATAVEPEKIKGMLEKGKDLLKDKSAKYIANRGAAEAVGTFLFSLNEMASKDIKTLIKGIGASTDIHELVGYYNLYSESLLKVFSATIEQQVDDMLREIRPAAAQSDRDKSHPTPPVTKTSGPNEELKTEIVSVKWKGHDMLASVMKQTYREMDQSIYQFQFWITPDMVASAQRLVKETVSEDVFKDQRVPEPEREDGDRVVTIGNYPSLAIVTVRRSKLTFKTWVSDDDLEGKQAQGRMQAGGIDNVAENDVAHFVKPPTENETPS